MYLSCSVGQSWSLKIATHLTRPKALIFVDADVIVRHFLDSGAFARLVEVYDTTLVFPPDDWNRLCNTSELDRWGLPVRRVAIPQSRRTLFGQLFFIDQARLRLDREWREIRSGWFAMVGWKAALKFSVLSLPGVRQLAIRSIRRRIAANPATELSVFLDEIRPDLLVHPSIFQGYFINDLLDAAKARSIPMMLLMNSWDNPSLKRSALGVPDAVAVWGEQTARHARKFMHVPDDRIHILGAAQFQLYRDPPAHDRIEVCARNGIDQSRRILLYAGSSKGNRESLHLRWLNDAISDGVLPSTTILYRPHPYGVTAEEARQILSDNLPNVVVEQSMRDLLICMAEGRHKGFFMTPYADTHDLLSAVDFLISPLSTILIEAGLHGKPALCFVPEEEDHGSIWSLLKDFVYFKELMSSPGLLLARSHAEFLPAVSRLFAWADEPGRAARIRSAMEYFVHFPPIRYDAALLELAHSLKSNRPIS